METVKWSSLQKHKPASQPATRASDCDGENSIKRKAISVKFKNNMKKKKSTARGDERLKQIRFLFPHLSFQVVWS